MKRLFIATLVLAALGGCATTDRYYSRIDDDRVVYSYPYSGRYHNYYSFNDRYDTMYGYELREHGS
jgi:hypothetical protein